MSLYQGVGTCPKEKYRLDESIIWNQYSHRDESFLISDYVFYKAEIIDKAGEDVCCDMFSFDLKYLKQMAEDLLNKNYVIENGRMKDYYDDMFDDEEFIEFLNYCWESFMKLYEKADKENDWAVYYREWL